MHRKDHSWFVGSDPMGAKSVFSPNPPPKGESQPSVNRWAFIVPAVPSQSESISSFLSMARGWTLESVSSQSPENECAHGIGRTKIAQ